jgi:hypothetical protein
LRCGRAGTEQNRAQKSSEAIIKALANGFHSRVALFRSSSLERNITERNETIIE